MSLAAFASLRGAYSQIGARTVLIAVALIATVCVPIAMGGTEALRAMLDFSPWGYFVIFSLIALNWLARALKLQLLLKRLGVVASFKRALGASLATDFGFMITPAGIGGYAASIFFLRKIGASSSHAATVTAADQLLDAAFFVIAIPIATLSFSGSLVSRLGPNLQFGAIVILVVLAIFWLVRRMWAKILREDEAPAGRLRRVVLAVRDFARRVRADAQVLLSAGAGFSLGACALTILQQIGRYGVLWVIFREMGYRISFPRVFVLQALIVQAAAWTGMPSGGGAAEIGLSAGFSEYISGPAMATALLLWRLDTLYLGLIAGCIAIAWLSNLPAPRMANDASGS